MIHLQIEDRLSVGEATAEQLKGWVEEAARHTLQDVGAPADADLSVVLTDDDHLREMNRQYRGIDAATDVLSFPSGEIDPDSEAAYLGDVIISYPRALAQAKAGGHAPADEVRLLTVHGVLHLLGYDHVNEAEKTEMWRVQGSVLKKLGSSIEPP